MTICAHTAVRMPSRLTPVKTMIDEHGADETVITERGYPGGEIVDETIGQRRCARKDDQHTHPHDHESPERRMTVLTAK